MNQTFLLSLKSALLVLVLFSITACHTRPPAITPPPSSELQAHASHAEVLEGLIAGNARFAEGRSRQRNWPGEIRLAAPAQYPLAMIVSCMDSRVPVETLFDARMGELFVVRIAGNVINDDVLGSLEYAAAVAGTRVIVVLGHTHCGAVKGAVHDVNLGHLTALLSKIHPAVDEVRRQSDSFSPSDHDALRRVIEANVRTAMTDIRASSDILGSRFEEKSLLLAGAIYDVETGRVRFLEN